MYFLKGTSSQCFCNSVVSSGEALDDYETILELQAEWHVDFVNVYVLKSTIWHSKIAQRRTVKSMNFGTLT